MAGSIATAYVQVMPSADGIKGRLTKQFGGEGTSAGGLFGSNLVKKALAVVSVAKISEALGKTLTEGAALQQSLGGIETLFKSSADKVIASAQQAYNTAGLSANAYMEQVTGFSASLLQSLAGDTEAAAGVADMAMRDMSDNANKFGTDMGRITDAYQGFAKQNYTMLDNLKLGYGGTKTEMQRLLKDAQALTGVKYDINNLSDVYNAIHAIQEELGVTGTTALEASSTLTGSFNAMKGAFSNVLGDLALGNDIKPSLNALMKTTGTFLKGNLTPMVLNIVKALPGAAGTLLHALIPANVQSVVSNAVTNFSTFLSQSLPGIVSGGVQMVSQLMLGFQSGFPGFMAAVSGLLSQVLTSIVAALPTLMEGGVNIITQLLLGFISAIPTFMAGAASLVQSLLNAIVAVAPKLLSSGAQLITNLVTGLLSVLPSVISSATTIITNLLSSFASHLPDLLAQGISLIGQLVAGLISMIPDVISAAIDIGKGIIDTISQTDWISLGKDIINGIVTGIKNAASSMFNALKDLASQALQAAKDALGIESPSKKFRDGVGRWIPAGIAAGIRGNSGMVSKALGELSDTAAGEFTSALRVNAPKSGVRYSPDGLGGKVVHFVQNVYAKAQSAAELAEETRYQAEMKVLLGV